MVPWVFTAICISPLRKSTSLYFCTWNILFFFPWNLSCIFSFAVMWFGLFFLNEMRRKRIFSTHVWRERKRKTSRLLYRCISLVFSTRGTLFLRPYYLSVLSLSFELRSDNVNWNSCVSLSTIIWADRITNLNVNCRSPELSSYLLGVFKVIDLKKWTESYLLC